MSAASKTPAQEPGIGNIRYQIVISARPGITNAGRSFLPGQRQLTAKLSSDSLPLKVKSESSAVIIATEGFLDARVPASVHPLEPIADKLKAGLLCGSPPMPTSGNGATSFRVKIKKLILRRYELGQLSWWAAQLQIDALEVGNA